MEWNTSMPRISKKFSAARRSLSRLKILPGLDDGERWETESFGAISQGYCRSGERFIPFSSSPSGRSLTEISKLDFAVSREKKILFDPSGGEASTAWLILLGSALLRDVLHVHLVHSMACLACLACLSRMQDPPNCTVCHCKATKVNLDLSRI